MKKTMLATALGLALMPLTFAAQTPAKPATDSQSNPPASTSTAKPSVKKHKKHNAKKPTTKTPATSAPSAAAPQK